jgi:hypothetical protein
VAITYDFPTDNVLSLIDKDLLDNLLMTDPIFSEFPMTMVDDHLVTWEQQDNTLGLAQARGLNGAQPSVKRLGGKRYQMEPGVYGEFLPIDENELTRRRPWGMFSGNVDVSDLVTECQNQLMTRQMNRQRWIIWQLLINGAFTVTNALGAIVHRDTYQTNTFASSVLWTTTATATPLNDFRQVQLLNRGHSVSFAANAKAYMNQTTLNALLNNNNTADLYGRRTSGLGTFNNLQQVNTLLMGDGLPEIVVYDEGYLSDGTDGNTAGSFQLYIPSGIVVVLGRRSNGARIGDIAVTRHASLNGQPGIVSKVIDYGDRQIPRKIEVHRAWNSGPRLFYPSSIVIMSVS